MATKKGTAKGAAKPRKPKKTEAEDRVVEVRNMPAAALKRAINGCNAILEDNAGRAGEIGSIVRSASEQGMDGQAFRILLRLYRKAKNNPHTLGAILRSFDYGREALGLDDMVPKDFFEKPPKGRRSHKKDAPEDGRVDDPAQTDMDADLAAAGGDNVANLDQHRAAAG
jgi:hypothetical protein